MVNNTLAIPRLDEPVYNWWNECLNRVAHTGRATVFPKNIRLAATRDIRAACLCLFIRGLRLVDVQELICLDVLQHLVDTTGPADFDRGDLFLTA